MNLSSVKRREHEPLKCETEGAWAFRPMNCAQSKQGFSPGPSLPRKISAQNR